MNHLGGVDAIRLSQLLQGCHSILAVGWPRPGIPEMAGAWVFTNTNAFKAFEDGVAQANEEFEKLCRLFPASPACPIWQTLNKMVAQLKLIGRDSQNREIDPTYNLLYFATGVLHHEISSKLNVSPTPVERFPAVEPLDELLSKCSWSHSTHLDMESLMKDLAIEMERCLNTLQTSAEMR